MITCFNGDVRTALVQAVQGKYPELVPVIKQIPDCPDDTPMGFVEHKRRQRKGQPSAYQQFISKCMKGQKIKASGDAPRAMKTCAAEWRKQKNAAR